MIVSIEAAREEHVREILPKLRAREQKLVAGIADPAAALLAEVRGSSEAYAVLFDGAVACLWGIQARSILADAVYLWMLTSRAIEAHPIVVGRHSRRMCRSILAEYAAIEGVVALDNPTSMRWLQWLGAAFEPSPIDGMLNFRLRRAA
jgi:hypothetical protein